MRPNYEMRPGGHGVAGTGPQNPGSLPEPNPVLTRTGYQNRTTWVEGVPISHKSEVQVHVQHQLGVEGRLAAYELVGPKWQLNVITVHVPFGDTTEAFLEHLMEAYRQLAMMGPTVNIGDLNAAPSADDRGGRQTPEDAAVQVAMQHLGLQDPTASLRGQPSHRPPKPCVADSRIDLCYVDWAHVEMTRAQYHDLPSKITGHRPLEIQIKVLQVPPASSDGMDHEEQPPIMLPGDHRHTHLGSVLPHGTTHPRPTRQDGPQPRHATSGHGMRPQLTTQNTGRYHPASRPTIPGHTHMARQASTTHGSALT